MTHWVSIKRLLTPLGFACWIILHSSCEQPENKHIAPLMESQQKVSRGIAELAVWHVDSVQAAKARIEERFDDLDWLMPQESLTKSPQDGPIIGDWSRAKRFLKDGPDRLVKLKIEGQLCLDQIDHLMTDIRSNVERDLEGTPIDEAYLKQATSKEIHAANQFELAAQETSRLVRLGLELEQQARPSIDSLIRAKRAEWAQQIAQDP